MPLPAPVSATELEALAVRFGTPYQLYDETLIRSNCKSLIQAFSAQFPGFKQFFAVKALPNPAILRILVEEGCGLDCSSISELHIAQALGVKGSDCMYTSNYTSKKDLAHAFDQGVVMNLDDISLVQSLVEVRGRVPELVSFRLNPGLGRTDSETKSNVLGGPDAKFGVAPFQIVDAYRAAQKAGGTRFGIHMMTGSCVINTAYWDDTVTVLLDTVAKVNAELGITFEFINIGGGLGIPYRQEQPVVDVNALAIQLQQCVSKRWEATGLGKKGLQPPRLFMENGRYMTGPFGWLVARCEVVKETWAKYYGLDACMSNLMRPGMYNAYHYISVPAREEESVKKNSELKKEIANVVGTLCENNDWFAKDRELPVSTVGDLFVIHDTGAHSHSMGFQYNGKLRAPELLLRRTPTPTPLTTNAGVAISSTSTSFLLPTSGRKIDLIREREQISCLYDNTMLPADLAIAGSGTSLAYPYTATAAAAAGSVTGGGGERRNSVVVIAEEMAGRARNIALLGVGVGLAGMAIGVASALLHNKKK